MNWIAVDWGTTHLRAWLMSEGCKILEARHSDQGMATLKANEFEAAILNLSRDWLSSNLKTPVIACGMVGAKQGWIEAPYSTVPCAPDAGTLIKPNVNDSRLDVFIRSGLSQKTPSADVMRGEETQISGLIAHNPDFDGVACLPGTHTKWAHISTKEVVSFQTFMTGELFSLLCKYSVLKHSIPSEGWDQECFEAAVQDVISRPANISAKLFELRASDLLQGADEHGLRAALSGYLIGLELGGARPYWSGQEIAMIGESNLTTLYAKALNLQGASCKIYDATEMTISGLIAAFLSLKGSIQ